MTEPAAEVRVRIVADDQSHETLDKVRDGLRDIGEESKVTQELLKGIGLNIERIASVQQANAGKQEGVAKEVLKGNLYFEAMKKSVELVGDGVKEAWELTEKLADASLEAAEAAETQEKQMAGYLFLLDQGKHSMTELREYTRDQREEFEKFAITAGVATKDLVTTYDKLLERGAMGSEKAKEMAEKMATVGKIVPGGSEALAQGMSAMETGMVRARNPLVQLIAATHMLKGNAKAVAAQMQHMTPERQMELAEKAIDRQAEALKKMGGVVPDLGQLKSSFEDVKEGFLESMGKPMTEALVPQLVRLRDYLSQHMEQIKQFGDRVGAAAANAIEYVSHALEGIWSGLTYNWDEFRDTFNSIFVDWEAAWGDSKTTTAEIKQEFFAVGTTLRDIFLDISRTIKAVVEVAMDVNDVIHGRNVGTTQAEVAGSAIHAGAGDVNQTPKQWEHLMDTYLAKAQDSGMDPAKVDAYATAMRNLHGQFEQAAQDDKQAVDSHQWDKVSEALKYNAENNQGALNEFIIKTLAGSDAAAEAIHSGQINIGGQMDELMKMISEKAPELAAKLRDMNGKIAKEGGIKAPKPTMVFTGPIHIKQDFKDQDPDRILLTFRKDLAQAAANRTTSRNAALFGM